MGGSDVGNRMSRISAVDMLFVDDLFEADPGYVMDFSNRTFANFFRRELNIDIYDARYEQNGTSKANRLRCYLQTADAEAAAAALKCLWDYREALHLKYDKPDPVRNARSRLFNLVRRLEGGQPTAEPSLRQARPNSTLLQQLSADLQRL